jgi:hypothetical protein
VATAVRAARFPAALWADLASPRLVFSFFTIVAATDVLALGMDLRGFATVALGMWLVAFAVWLILIYLGFAVLMFVNKAGGAKVIDGGWLNAIVGTQSLVILGTQVRCWRCMPVPPCLCSFTCCGWWGSGYTEFSSCSCAIGCSSSS